MIKKLNVVASKIGTRKSERRFQSLYLRFSINAVILVSLIGLLQLYYSTQSFRALVQQIDQQLYWDVAAELNNRIAPLVKDKIDSESFKGEFYQIYNFDRKTELFLLSEDGRVIEGVGCESGLRQEKVDLAPIRKALQVENPEMPLLGTSPCQSSPAVGTFTVSPTVIEGKPGYLYVILESSSYGRLIRGNGQFFIARTMIVGFMLISLLGIGVGILVFQYLTRSFRGLTDVVRSYQGDDFEARVKVERNDEIGELGTAINRMAKRIEEGRAALKETDQRRREMIANISHDLKNPMASIQGAVQTLELHHAVIDEDKKRLLMKIIADNVNRQEGLVGDLFELARLDAKERTPDKQRSNIVEIVQDAALGLSPQAKEKGIVIECDLAEDNICSEVDPVMIDRVVVNLVKNAISYTPESGKVIVSIAKLDSIARVSISDSGVGIDEQEMSKIFDPMYRVDKTRQHDTGGTGLGLAIVKRILELHDSDINVKSRIDEGSTFYFDLPVI